MITDDSSALTVQIGADEPHGAERAAFVAGWVRGFVVGEALAAAPERAHEPKNVEPAVKSES